MTATAGPDILTEGQDGWIVAPGELEGLAGAMTVCLEQPRRVREMGMAAREKALQFTWSAYGDRWMEILTDLSG